MTIFSDNDITCGTLKRIPLAEGLVTDAEIAAALETIEAGELQRGTRDDLFAFIGEELDKGNPVRITVPSIGTVFGEPAKERRPDIPWFHPLCVK